MVMDYFQKANVLHTVIGRVMEVDGVSKYVAGQPMAYIPAVLQLLGVLCLIPLIKHAFATTEYNIDGAYGAGMRTFRVFSFFLFIVIGIAVASQYLLGGVVFTVADGVVAVEVVKVLNMEMLNVVVISLVMFIIEVLMRNMPGHKRCGCKRNANGDSNASVVVYVN